MFDEREVSDVNLRILKSSKRRRGEVKMKEARGKLPGEGRFGR